MSADAVPSGARVRPSMRSSVAVADTRFVDVHGEVVASRVFRASEYLGGEMRGLKLMPSETEVRLSLEIIDPGIDALGYQMEVVPL